MRVTEQTTAAVLLRALQGNRQRSESLQQQITTGLKITAPSVDPAAAQQIMFYKQSLGANQQYVRNINSGIAQLNQMDGAMGEMTNALARAREITVAMANGTNDAASRLSSMQEIRQLKDQLIALGNSQIGGKYVFGGFRTDQMPFDTALVNLAGDPSNGTMSGAYLGTNDNALLEIDQQSYVSVSYSGGELLRGGTPPGATGTDIIASLDRLIGALASNNQAGVAAELTPLEAGQAQIATARGDLGARMNRLDSTMTGLENFKINMTKVLSDRQDVDFADTLSELTKQQTAYSAILASSAKIVQESLLDYLK